MNHTEHEELAALIEHGNFENLKKEREKSLLRDIRQLDRGIITDNEFRIRMQCWRAVNSELYREYRRDGDDDPSLRDALYITDEDTAPVPDSITARPDVRQVHNWGQCEVSCIRFDCVDFGGLTESEDPVGKDYILMRNDGVKAHVRITLRHCTGEPDVKDDLGKTVSDSSYGDSYEGIGWIEDYFRPLTAPDRHNIEFFIRDGVMTDMYYYRYQEFADEDLCSFSPRWAEYRLWCEEKSRKVAAIYESLTHELRCKYSG